MDLNVGVIGVGALGRHHARIFAALDGARLVGVADSSESRGRAVAETHGCEWFPDYRELLSRIDAVSIAVPTFAHREVAFECLSRGIPMMMEKPLAGNLRDAREIAELAEETGVVLQVGHVERFNPATRAARSLCGSPRYIRSSRVSPFSFRSTDISIVHDLMIHDLDLILELVDSPPTRIQAFGVALFGEHEDAVQAHLTFENGCIADVTASRVCPVAARTMQIWSSTGCTDVDFTARTATRYSPGEALRNGLSPVQQALQPGADVEALKARVFGEFIEIERADVPADDALTAELAHFVACVRTGKTPECDGWKAVDVLELADRIQQSVRAHQWERGVIGPHVLQRSAPQRKSA